MKAHSTFVPFVVIVFVFFARTANSQPFQKALDTTTTSIGMVGGITSTTDGGYIMVLNTDSGDVQWKADATGQAQWAKHYSVGSANRARMPDGGIVFGELGTYIQGDTSYAHYKVVRTDASGAVEWSKLLTLEKTTLTSSPFTKTNIAVDANGTMLISVGFLESYTEQWFVSLTATGVLLWSRYYSLDAYPDAASVVVSDGNAGWFFAYAKSSSLGVVAWAI